MLVQKIVSGGQTGVDRVALDVAIDFSIPHGGWCPQGRRSESGRIPDIYQLSETESTRYSERTERNVIDSDGTLVLYRPPLSGGTAFTVKMVARHRRPYYLVDLDSIFDRSELIHDVRSWLDEEQIRTLNVAGPRASHPGTIEKKASDFLRELLRPA